MIEYKKGDLLDVTSGCIVHSVNMQGVMGSGVARAIKQQYPLAYTSYRKAYELGKLKLGYVDWVLVADGLFVANCVGQYFYGTDGKRYTNYAALAVAFYDVIEQMRICNDLYPDSDTTINFPKIGAGLGGGDWAIIEQIINDSDPTDSVRKICWEL